MGQWDQGDDWVRRSRRACPDDVLRSIVEDNLRGGDIHRPSSPIAPAKAKSEEPQNKSGWVEPPKVDD
jgi:hypothetical protein